MFSQAMREMKTLTNTAGEEEVEEATVAIISLVTTQKRDLEIKLLETSHSAHTVRNPDTTLSSADNELLKKEINRLIYLKAQILQTQASQTMGNRSSHSYLPHAFWLPNQKYSIWILDALNICQINCHISATSNQSKLEHGQWME